MSCRPRRIRYYVVLTRVRGIGRILLAVPGNVHARYFATFCIVSGTYTTIGIIIAWCTSNLYGFVQNVAH